MGLESGNPRSYLLHQTCATARVNLPFITHTILTGCFSRSSLFIWISPFTSTWHLKTEEGAQAHSDHVSAGITTVVQGSANRSSSSHSFLPGAGNLPKTGLFLQLQREQHKITNSILKIPKPLSSIPSADGHRRHLTQLEHRGPGSGR